MLLIAPVIGAGIVLSDINTSYGAIATTALLSGFRPRSINSEPLSLRMCSGVPCSSKLQSTAKGGVPESSRVMDADRGAGCD